MYLQLQNNHLMVSLFFPMSTSISFIYQMPRRQKHRPSSVIAVIIILGLICTITSLMICYCPRSTTEGNVRERGGYPRVPSLPLPPPSPPWSGQGYSPSPLFVHMKDFLYSLESKYLFTCKCTYRTKNSVLASVLLVRVQVLQMLCDKQELTSKLPIHPGSKIPLNKPLLNGIYSLGLLFSTVNGRKSGLKLRDKLSQDYTVEYKITEEVLLYELNYCICQMYMQIICQMNSDPLLVQCLQKKPQKQQNSFGFKKI